MYDFKVQGSSPKSKQLLRKIGEHYAGHSIAHKDGH
nr:MAG TPA: hypothetical protein [Caudoviricetes sp.]